MHTLTQRITNISTYCRQHTATIHQVSHGEAQSVLYGLVVCSG